MSILLPTYDAAPFLLEQLMSISAQRMSDFEVLVIDDGSKDETRELLRKYAERDSRFRVLPSSGNVGQKSRLRELISHTVTDLIAVADQDDIWHPCKLELLTDGLDANSMSFGSSWIIDNMGKQNGRTISDLFPPIPKPNDRLSYLFKPAVSAHAMIARRDIFSHMSLMRSHPFDWLQALDAAFASGVTYVANAVTFHRVHGGNQSNSDLGQRSTNIAQYAKVRLQKKLKQRLTERLMLCQRFEHLSFSAIINETSRAKFAQALTACSAAWYGQGWRAKDGAKGLELTLCQILEPLAGSNTDWDFAKSQVKRITRPTLHPYNIRADFKALVRNSKVSLKRSSLMLPIK